VIQVIVKLSPPPRDVPEVVRALRSLQMAMQSVRGLVCSHIYTDSESANSLLYVEEWREPEHLGQESVVAHFKQLFALMERSSRAPVLRVATLRDPSGIEHLSMLMNPRSKAGGPNAPDVGHIDPTARQPKTGSP
jgi:quinol monooxygenase YgiN